MGMAITDDPDQGSFDQFKTLYDLLLRLHLPTTRAMWVYEPSEATGTPALPIKFFAPVLTEKKCLDYCKMLHENGFEICLHGASSGNNTREGTKNALEYLENEIGPSSVYICHSKNAENLYWDEKCVNARFFSAMLRLYTKNKCFGEIEGSKFFWGDICKDKIRFIRLFRTRQVNTLAFNPSMPYHDANKPYVNYWFSATKGYLARLLEPYAIDCVCRENGASILYQYLHKYVNDKGEIDPLVKTALERIAADSRIFFRPVSVILERLKQFQLLFFLLHKGTLYIINASKKPIESVQLLLEFSESIDLQNETGVSIKGRSVSIESIQGLSVRKINGVIKGILTQAPLAKMHGDIAELRFSCGTIVANLSADSVVLPRKLSKFANSDPKNEIMHGHSVKVYYTTLEFERMEILKRLSATEERRLFWGQAKILLREHLLLGRKLSSEKYLKKPGDIEDQSNW
jgi:hypothetical protein